jgi:hypothetical protein
VEDRKSDQETVGQRDAEGQAGSDWFTLLHKVRTVKITPMRVKNVVTTVYLEDKNGIEHSVY